MCGIDDGWCCKVSIRVNGSASTALCCACIERKWEGTHSKDGVKRLIDYKRNRGMIIDEKSNVLDGV